MSVTSAERKVARLKDQLRVAYDELRRERAKSEDVERARANRTLDQVYETLTVFCDQTMLQRPDLRECGVDKLQIRERFVVCALADRQRQDDIAAQLPKIVKIRGNVYYKHMGITTYGVRGLMSDAREQLRRLNMPPLHWPRL